MRLICFHMKIFIQHIGTQKYLRGVATWVKKSAGAHLFPSSFDAVLYCLKRGLAGVNIVIERPRGRRPLIVLVDKTALKEAGAELKVKPAQ